jgi:hypothetical protein
MSFGFQIFNADGTIQVDSNSLGILFIDDFVVNPGAPVSNTYAGLAASTITVLADGDGNAAPAATITQSTSGADKVIQVSVVRKGRFRVMLEE